MKISLQIAMNITVSEVKQFNKIKNFTQHNHKTYRQDYGGFTDVDSKTKALLRAYESTVKNIRRNF